jgi:hypothetical protein
MATNGEKSSLISSLIGTVWSKISAFVDDVIADTFSPPISSLSSAIGCFDQIPIKDKIR